MQFSLSPNSHSYRYLAVPLSFTLQVIKVGGGGACSLIPRPFSPMLVLQLTNTGAGNEVRGHESLGMHGANYMYTSVNYMHYARCWPETGTQTSELETV